MVFAVRSIAIDGTTIDILNGVISPGFVEGNVKQFSGGRWRAISIPNKNKLRTYTITGHVQTDEERTTLEGFRDENTYSYSDGVDTLTNIAVMSLSFSHSFNRGTGHERWFLTLVVEEYDQG